MSPDARAWVKALAVTFTLALITLFALVMVNASQLPRTPGSADTSLLGLTFFTATREALPNGGTSVALQPGPGAVVVLLLAIAAAGGLVALSRRRRAAATPHHP